MEEIIEQINRYISGVIDLFDDGVFSLGVLLVLIAALVGIFLYADVEELMTDGLINPSASGFRKIIRKIIWKLLLILLLVALGFVLFYFS